MTKEDLQQISELFQENNKQLEKMMDAKLDAKLAPINQRLDGMDHRLDGMDHRLDGMDQRLDGMDQRLDGMEQRLERVEDYSRQTRVLLERQEHNIRLIAEQYGDISMKLARVNEIDDLRDRVRTLEFIVRNTRPASNP